jgi:hypothetical protein
VQLLEQRPQRQQEMRRQRCPQATRMMENCMGRNPGVQSALKRTIRCTVHEATTRLRQVGQRPREKRIANPPDRLVVTSLARHETEQPARSHPFHVFAGLRRGFAPDP